MNMNVLGGNLNFELNMVCLKQLMRHQHFNEILGCVDNAQVYTTILKTLLKVGKFLVDYFARIAMLLVNGGKNNSTFNKEPTYIQLQQLKLRFHDSWFHEVFPCSVICRFFEFL